MLKTIFVGNLPPDISKDEIRELFSQHGVVHSVRMAVDRETRNFRGFGFVEMKEEDVSKAVQGLAGTDLRGFVLRAADLEIFLALLELASQDEKLRVDLKRAMMQRNQMKLQAALTAVAERTKEIEAKTESAWEDFSIELVAYAGAALAVYAGAAAYVGGDSSIAEALKFTVRFLEQARDEAWGGDD